jgi:hypothetical protein
MAGSAVARFLKLAEDGTGLEMEKIVLLLRELRK